MNLGLGTLGQIEMLFKSGIIFKIIDITNFYINDKLDKELNELLVISLLCLGNIIMGGHPEVNKSIIIYNKSTIVSIFCNALKLGFYPVGSLDSGGIACALFLLLHLDIEFLLVDGHASFLAFSCCFSISS